MGRCLGIAALILALGQALPVGAYQIAAVDLLDVPRPKSIPKMGFTVEEVPLNYLNIVRPPYDPEVLTSELLRDENLDALNAFSNSSTVILPMLSAQIYAVEISRLSQLKKTPFMTMEEWQEREYDKSRPGWVWIMGNTQSPRALITEKAMFTREEKKTGLAGYFSWLTEEEGLFSGRPWDWDNFLPRIFTAAGIILGLLVAVEFMHIIVMVGVRGMGGKQRRSRG